MSSTSWFSFQSLMNLLLINHPTWSKRNLLKNEQTAFLFHEENLFICLTGLKKTVYTNVLGMQTLDYVELYYSMDLDTVIQHYGYIGNTFFLFNDGTKRIVILFSPAEHPSVPPTKLIENITEYIQSFYEEQLFNGCTYYPNTSSLVPVSHGFDGIQDAFEQADTLHNLSFFVTKPTVFTESWSKENIHPLNFQTLINLLREFDSSLLSESKDITQRALEHLFMDKLKKSASLSLCRDALLYLKSTFELYFTVYGIDRIHELDSLFSLSTYPSIDHCWCQLQKLLSELQEKMLQSTITSEAVLNAIYYIRHHYASADLSLADIAHYVNVNQNYLSSLFKQQTGLSIRQFITNERIQKAKALLNESNMSIQAIASTCGFLDVKYFSQVFRQATSTTPQVYRSSSSS